MTRSMCLYCNRAPRKPHLGNCPEMTGIKSTSRFSNTRRDAYLRRQREAGRSIYPHVLYLVERELTPGTPADFYHNGMDTP